MFLFFPVPAAVLYNSFKEQRIKLMIRDRLKQKEALMLTFICTDFEMKQFMNQSDFLQLMKGLYGSIYSESNVRHFCMIKDGPTLSIG